MCKNDTRENLDASKLHKLTEQECELIDLYRLFSKRKRNIIYKKLFEFAMNDDEIET